MTMPYVTDPSPPSSDPMHSMQMVAEADALMHQAREMVAKAYKLAKDEWKWHREDCGYRMPKEMEDSAKAAMENMRLFNAGLHWTANSLRKNTERLDFQTAPYEALCGCVAVDVPASASWAYQDHGVEVANHEMTRRLIEANPRRRIVLANCQKCHGSGLKGVAQ